MLNARYQALTGIMNWDKFYVLFSDYLVDFECSEERIIGKLYAYTHTHIYIYKLDMFNNITLLREITCLRLNLQIAANSVLLSSESINLIYSNLVLIIHYS